VSQHRYEIRVKGWLENHWQSWYAGLTVQRLAGGQSVLSGRMDQAMLRGILTKISDLGLELVSVQRLGKEDTKEDHSSKGENKSC
jgi:hypothetical protein